MIRTIKGQFRPLKDGTAVIETKSGIGFLVYLPLNSTLYKNYDGEEVKIYTAMTVKDDDISLYGFESLDELELFKLLMTVSGVGAKGALSIMGILPPDELKRAIASGDSNTVRQASGIGKKTAERIIVDLADKVGEYESKSQSVDIRPTFLNGMNGERAEAIAALRSLGYMPAEAEDAVGKVRDEGLTAEEYIKLALRNNA